ncbi:gamma-tubulin complex component 4 homolog [Stomoxys calcitrans]|uniref:gamma-tubulin complex component 4 homolog n=1 Tax=Stomoxys calcitrans TaxID=35570 RepID=UPI0027E218F0|nr:gamma-tubulin complex component 4 homolog [Stomoxys calcitrans]
MIHDIILSCINLHSDQLPIEEFLVSEAVSKYFHPCERNILEDIIKIINLLRDIARFVQIYSGNRNATLNTSVFDTDEPLQNGLYLKAFCNGMSEVLDGYLHDVADLERKYLIQPNQSLMFVYQKLQEYEPLALYLSSLIRGVCSQRLHGCAIIQYLQQHSLHGDARAIKAVRLIQAKVNVIFLKQLTHWILYAKLQDSYGEFFIQCSEGDGNSTLESDKATTTGRTWNSEAACYADIWRYEVCYELLPSYLSFVWAEKVLFIGQTVLIFKVDTDKLTKKCHIWNTTENDFLDHKQTFWNDKEHVYFAKIQALHQDEELIVSHYESVIDELKCYVTTRLSEIAVNQADLVKQLKLLKDFFLLGRGELFLEYIRQIYIIDKEKENANKMRDFVKAFESAAHSIGVGEELDQFSVSMPKAHADSEESLEFGYLQLIQLQYKINWPLHLLFSPKVLERYNVLFRFLILIKKMQYDLHMIWTKSSRKSKLKFDHSVKVMLLRNELMFFVDNLQYYIQADVLDSQFSILLNTVLNEADFEQIQRAHSVFQANILSLCFLQTDAEDISRTNVLQTSATLNSNNPVYLIINEVFHICNDFCAAIDNERGAETTAIDQIADRLGERFGSLVQQLINLLVGLKSAPSTAPLSQLLLRLDYNHWFSNKKMDTPRIS